MEHPDLAAPRAVTAYCPGVTLTRLANSRVPPQITLHSAGGGKGVLLSTVTWDSIQDTRKENTRVVQDLLQDV